ncbi:DUF2849 domain-containing protein [Acetobacteraceae bacterium EV16G]|uniref:DUF2849 domain-containing protein n=1 Tax=Sorlinia euscelidii TaxID=3081148 RepID=A0ABU7U3C3_9PROT
MKRSIRIADDNKVVITGNRLKDGRIVWLAASGQWSNSIYDAQQLDSDVFQTYLDDASKRAAGDGIIDVYEVPVTPGHPPSPISMRERIRAFGPTTHPQFAVKSTP